MKLIFLVLTRAVSVLGLSRRESWWKDAEILMMRHQLAVAQRERPRAHSRLAWPDRAWLALLAEPGPANMRQCPIGGVAASPENESGGYHRIHAELAGLAIAVAPSTVWQILKSARIDPAPRRDGPGWAGFLRSQAQAILALDFFTVDLLNGTKVYVLAVTEHGTRRIRILGATKHPVQSWTVQQASNLLMDLEGARMNVKFVLHDRDASFTAAFDGVFPAAGVRIVRSEVQAPRMNSIMERWIGSCQRELLDRTLIWNQRHLMSVLHAYEDFYYFRVGGVTVSAV